MAQSNSWNTYKFRLKANDSAWSLARVINTKAMDENSYWSLLSKRNGIICLFVHGYDESMIDSIRDTAAIGVALSNKEKNQTITPILFSWPSYNSTSEYTSDEENMNWSKVPFRTFVEKLATIKAPNTKLYIIGHSLGSRLVFDLTNSQKLLESPKIDKIVLSSSDFDYHQALQQKERLERLVKENISVLVSDRDGPLLTSQLLHKTPRLGRPIDPPNISSSTNSSTATSTQKKSFWRGILSEASNFLSPKTTHNSQETLKWLSAGKSQAIELGPKSKFYDVTELVTADLGHRLAWPVITSLLANANSLKTARISDCF